MTSWWAALWNRVFQAWQCFKCLLGSLYKRMDECLRFNCAWFHQNWISPLMNSNFECFNDALFPLDLPSILLTNATRWWIDQEKCKLFEENLKKLWENFFFEFFGDSKSKVGKCEKQLEICVIYSLLIRFLIMLKQW